MALVIAEPARPLLAVEGTQDRFPVRRVYCVARNYAAHAREMGADPNREPPFFFSKPADALTQAAEVPYPPATQALDHEVELVIALKGGGVDLDPATVPGLLYGAAVGVDLTRRDLQAEAKMAGRPWDMAKGFDHSAPIGLLRPLSSIPQAGRIALSINGVERQAGDISDMVWTIPALVAHLSRLVRLEAGDVIFTGTPEGVGMLIRGDRVQATVEGLPTLEFTVA